VLIGFFAAVICALFDFYERRGARMRVGLISFLIALSATGGGIVYLMIGRLHGTNTAINHSFAVFALLMLAGAIWQVRARVDWSRVRGG
jgi:hypothetical protein